MSVKSTQPQHELFHEIFGSILDRSEMTPYLLLRASGYRRGLAQVTKMMANRGFDTRGAKGLPAGEQARAQGYIRRALSYLEGWLFPALEEQLRQLLPLATRNRELYQAALATLARLREQLASPGLRGLIDEDPRHLFLLASSRRYPHIFAGRGDVPYPIPSDWQKVACALLKMGYLVRSIEEDSQDIADFAEFGMFLQSQGARLDDLYRFPWHRPPVLPKGEPAIKAFVKLAAFFRKLDESMRFDRKRQCLVFDSGDGVEVDIVDVKARLKSPESMFTKLGKNVESEAYDIRDVLAVTFVLRSRDDTLKLFHALQKRGVILQENTVSHAITQTLFDRPAMMRESVRRLLVSLGHSAGKRSMPTAEQLQAHARGFFKALGVNARRNPHSSRGHRKFQCKINFSVVIHRQAETGAILIPGTPAFARRDEVAKESRQHTLPVELRILDAAIWRDSELRGDSHHAAYKFRQLTTLAARLFGTLFRFPDSALPELRRDQNRLFA